MARMVWTSRQLATATRPIESTSGLRRPESCRDTFTRKVNKLVEGERRVRAVVQAEPAPEASKADLPAMTRQPDTPGRSRTSRAESARAVVRGAKKAS
ncbi:non-homologous end joining protein Ku [Kutzneria viridogrisea]|nr:hypothetical protein [Kutzneria albida]MBA8924348.1 non-homologous end joining protein Ku [Kutzneria viridogrisea]